MDFLTLPQLQTFSSFPISFTLSIGLPFPRSFCTWKKNIQQKYAMVYKSDTGEPKFSFAAVKNLMTSIQKISEILP